MSCPVEQAKAVQVYLFLSVTPAHSTFTLSKGKEAFDPDLHVWHIGRSLVSGVCSQRQRGHEKDSQADPAGTEPNLTVSSVWTEAKGEVLGYGGWRNERRNWLYSADLLTNP